MCSKRLLALAGVAASFLWVSAANAVTVSIGLQQAGVNSGNISPVASGIDTTVLFGGSYGTFTANAITANGSPPLSGSDLLGTTSSNISSSTAGVLSVWITAQNITSPISTAMSFISSFTENILSGPITSVAESTFLDTGNGLWTTAIPLSSKSFSAIGTAVLASLSENTGAGPYSITERYIITAAGAGNALSTIDVSATPLPAALPLFASGLGILWAFGKKRKVREILSA
jgi:hypothetical protein